MSWLYPGTWSRRQRKVWSALACTLIGVTAFTAFALWLAAARNTDLTDPTQGVTAEFRQSDIVSPLRFRDVAREMGIDFQHGPGERRRTLPEDTGSGVAWGDYDGDGDWDLYLVNYSASSDGPIEPKAQNRLFRNDGHRFTDVTREAGVADGEGFGMGATFVDYDGDGDVDLYVTNYGPNSLYRNRGDGSFEEVAASAGVADPLWSTGATWGDFDRDGHIDLYVTNYVAYEHADIDIETDAIPFTLNPNSFDPQPNRLYRNRGDGTFEDVAEACGVHNPEGRGLAATFCDLDGNGWLDLYINNDVSTNKLYQNLGVKDANGMILFSDHSAVTGTADPRGSMGLSVGEIGAMTDDYDGLPDLFITHWIAQENALYQSLKPPGGDLEYRDKTRRFRLGELSLDHVGWGCAMTDFDLDGWPDLVVANGSTLEVRVSPLCLQAEPIFLFWNDGARFHEVAAQAGAALSGRYWGRGLAVADFDRDGDVDIAIAVNRGQALLLRNETQTDHRALIVTLRAKAALCFGAKVEVTVGSRQQAQWWGADVSYLGMHAAEMVFGLGGRDRVDSIRVFWMDGKVSERSGVVAGRVEIAHDDVL